VSAMIGNLRFEFCFSRMVAITTKRANGLRGRAYRHYALRSSRERMTFYWFTLRCVLNVRPAPVGPEAEIPAPPGSRRRPKSSK
jgi:hypothetical protein